MINQDGGVSPVMLRYSHHNHQQSGDMWRDEECTMDVTPIPPPMLPPPPRTREETLASACWRSFAHVCTFLVHDTCIMCHGQEAKQAWREKVAIFMIMILSSIIFVGVGGFVPILL
eukprot:5133427-Ditylum_brightwellii.AAC.1